MQDINDLLLKSVTCEALSDKGKGQSENLKDNNYLNRLSTRFGVSNALGDMVSYKTHLHNPIHFHI